VYLYRKRFRDTGGDFLSLNTQSKRGTPHRRRPDDPDCSGYCGAPLGQAGRWRTSSQFHPRSSILVWWVGLMLVPLAIGMLYMFGD
jgi:hypothetical protein